MGMQQFNLAMQLLNSIACGWLNVSIAIQCGLHTCILDASFGRFDAAETELTLSKKHCFDHEEIISDDDGTLINEVIKSHVGLSEESCIFIVIAMDVAIEIKHGLACWTKP